LEDLNKAIENNFEPFVKDNNLGLVGQVRSALIDQNIKKLTATYVTITMPGLLENSGIEQIGDAELRIVKMVETRGFQAKIDQVNGYVTFTSTSEAYDTDSTSQHLRTHVHDLISLHKQIAGIDRNIEQNDRYVQKLLQGEKFPGRDDVGMDRGMGMMGFHI